MATASPCEQSLGSLQKPGLATSRRFRVRYDVTSCDGALEIVQIYIFFLSILLFHSDHEIVIYFYQSSRKYEEIRILPNSWGRAKASESDSCNWMAKKNRFQELHIGFGVENSIERSFQTLHTVRKLHKHSINWNHACYYTLKQTVMSLKHKGRQGILLLN